jgi:hypothetical protein
MRRSIVSWIVLVGVVSGAPLAAAQPEEVTALPGYVDLEELGLYEGELASLEISIHEPLISLVASAVGDDDSELSKILRGLKSIRLRTFPIPEGDGDRVRKRSAEMGQRLQRAGWESIVRVRDEGEDIQILLRTLDQQIAGMVLVAVEEGESVTLVNIVGSFDPEELGGLGRSLGVEPLEMIGEHTRRQREEE